MFTVILNGKPMGTFHTYEFAVEASEHLYDSLCATPGMLGQITHSDKYSWTVTMRPWLDAGDPVYTEHKIEIECDGAPTHSEDGHVIDLMM